MKNWILALALVISANAFASDVDGYCQDESTKVYYLAIEDSSGSIRKPSVLKGDLVAKLNDGTAVIVPCFKDYIVKKDRGPVESIIVKQKNIFSPLSGRLDDRLIIGANYEDATVLSFENHLLVMKTYSVQKSAELERLRREATARRIDRR